MDCKFRIEYSFLENEKQVSNFYSLKPVAAYILNLALKRVLAGGSIKFDLSSRYRIELSIYRDFYRG